MVNKKLSAYHTRISGGMEACYSPFALLLVANSQNFLKFVLLKVL